MSKFCPIHGDPNELPHMVNYCTCEKKMNFPINLVGELLAVKINHPSTEAVLLPDWKRSLSGVVIATGSDVKGVNDGDLVYFGAAVGMDSVLSGQDIRILKERDLDFVYENETQYRVAEQWTLADDEFPCLCTESNICAYHLTNHEA
jgi:hypothetical protein